MVKLLIDSATFHTHAPTRMDSQSGAAVGESKVFLHERVFGTSFNTGLYALGIMRMDPEIMAQMERSSAVSTQLDPDARCCIFFCKEVRAYTCAGFHMVN